MACPQERGVTSARMALEGRGKFLGKTQVIASTSSTRGSWEDQGISPEGGTGGHTTAASMSFVTFPS